MYFIIAKSCLNAPLTPAIQFSSTTMSCFRSLLISFSTGTGLLNLFYPLTSMVAVIPILFYILQSWQLQAEYRPWIARHLSLLHAYSGAR